VDSADSVSVFPSADGAAVAAAAVFSCLGSAVAVSGAFAASGWLSYPALPALASILKFRLPRRQPETSLLRQICPVFEPAFCLAVYPAFFTF